MRSDGEYIISSAMQKNVSGQAKDSEGGVLFSMGRLVKKSIYIKSG